MESAEKNKESLLSFGQMEDGQMKGSHDEPANSRRNER